MQNSFFAVILYLTVSGSAFANNSDPVQKHNIGLAHIVRLSSLSNVIAAAPATSAITPATNADTPATSTVSPSDIPFFKGKDHFEQKFPQATEVDCKVKRQFTEVNFIWNGIRLQAFYDLSGEPVATSRFVALNNLPLFVQMSLKKEYPSYVVTEAAEFADSDDGLSYYVSITGPKVSYLLHVSTSGTISVFKKMKQ